MGFWLENEGDGEMGSKKSRLSKSGEAEAEASSESERGEVELNRESEVEKRGEREVAEVRSLAVRRAFIGS